MIRKIIKTSAPNRKQPILRLPYFNKSPELCVASALKKYLDYTKNIRGNITELFISLKTPAKAISTQTISRWLKGVLKDSGIDTSIFSSHSVRHAATSHAYDKNIDIDTIRSTVGWTNGSEVFAKFYNLPVKTNYEFGNSV